MISFGVLLPTDALPQSLAWEIKRRRECNPALKNVSASSYEYLLIYAAKLRKAKRLLWREGISPWDFRKQRKADVHG